MNESDYRADERDRAFAFACFANYADVGKDPTEACVTQVVSLMRARPDLAEIGIRRISTEGIKAMERFLGGVSS